MTDMEIRMSSYHRAYNEYLKELTAIFKEKIIEETPTTFISLQDIFKTDSNAKKTQEYLIQCAKEHCPNMNPLFVDIFLSIYYNTNEPIDGNLLRMMYPKEIRPSCVCLKCLCLPPYLNKAKVNIDYIISQVLVPNNITKIDTYMTPCQNIHSGHLERNLNISISISVVRPEFIKFMLNNIDMNPSNSNQQGHYNKTYAEYYKYLENCMHPDKLGTVNFIVKELDISKEDLLQDSIDELTEKVNELLIKLDESNISDNRFKYILSLIK